MLNKHQANISRLAQAFGLSDKVGASVSQKQNKSPESNKSNQPPDGPMQIETTPARITSQEKAQELEESISKVKTPFDIEIPAKVKPTATVGKKSQNEPIGSGLQ